MFTNLGETLDGVTALLGQKQFPGVQWQEEGLRRLFRRGVCVDACVCACACMPVWWHGGDHISFYDGSNKIPSAFLFFWQRSGFIPLGGPGGMGCRGWNQGWMYGRSAPNLGFYGFCSSRAFYKHFIVPVAAPGSQSSHIDIGRQTDRVGPHGSEIPAKY